MKKFILVAAVATFALASCKKEWTCECTVSIPGSSTSTTSAKSSKMSKKDAKDWCDKGNTSYTSCKIK
ncbi:hypothetical protein [Fluviicola sp.]|jgi:hypothetical protein|uniref:hypothetical protein n=1 Tax=Fluviicola sp. TaxID=1917219 RepID=UPI00282EE00C|nr:hypothetical protein [Fluviicola sp.]MDR0801749.1 hypothetical protein [Fluviicola sp.]